MNEQQTTIAEVAKRAGIGVDTLRFWVFRHMPRLDLFEAALNVLDLELVIRPRRKRMLVKMDDPVSHQEQVTEINQEPS